jgi:hypothetical protein
MHKLTASNIVSFINQLDKKSTYNYLNPKNKGLIQLVSVDTPEGPIRIRRWDPTKGEKSSDKKIEPISPELIWRIANAFIPNQPINFDRVLAGSYNTRSVLETLLVHTPQFHYCYPGRIENTGGNPTVKNGHKHIIWTPDTPHKKGVIKKFETDVVISEIPTVDAVYEALVVNSAEKQNNIDINIQRRHAQIQIALYSIGLQLEYRTWIAQNDKGIIYNNKKIGEYEGMVVSLRDEKMLSAHEEAIRAALLIDCIWFKNGKLMPAVMEVEHSTGVTSGLSRMKNFQDHFPKFPTRYVIVAPDEDREKVIREANKVQFKDLNTRYFPYSSVEELYVLCKKRNLRGVTEDFLDCFMEPIITK